LTDETTAPDRDPPPPGRRPRLARRVRLALLAVLILIAGATVMLRFGVLTDPGRALIQAELDKASLGRFGRLHVEGLRGDVWRDFTIARLTLSDRDGVWLEVTGAHVRWRWWQLLRRRLDVDDMQAAHVGVLRRPTLSPPRPAGRVSMSLHLGRFFGQLETAPAFSYQRGLYQITGSLDQAPGGLIAGKVQALSLTHAGDRLDAVFDVGRDKHLVVDVEAREAQGGALAGALGLAVDQPFFLSAHAHGTISQGSFSLISRSGGVVPAVASGAWTPQGGSAAGQVTLAASRLLAGYQKMLGPQARFSIAGAKAADGLQALTVDVASDNLRLGARGEGDIGRLATGPKGLAVTLAVASGSRLIAWPQMGSANLSGVVTGGKDRWSLVGNLAVDAPAALGYRLARVQGPVKLALQGRQLTLDVALDGQGGAGSGLAAALLGGRPHAAAQLTRLADGRLVMTSLDLVGPGLKMTGQGQRGLLGGLSFKGAAIFSNFAAAKRGAKGVMTANWSASQPGGEAPWTFTLDAGAKGFASGVDNLDRLLGASPTLKGQASYDGKTIRVASADLRGANGGASASGAIGGDGGLDMKLAWNAKGPFEAGPLEISVAGMGTGAVGGSLLTPKADLAADFDSFALPGLDLTAAHVTLSFQKGPQETNGAFALAAASQYGPAHAASGFRFVSDGLALSDIDATAGGARLQGAIALLRGEPSSADLTVALAPGAFLSRGQASGRLQIVDAQGGPNVTLKASATGADLRIGAGLIVQTASVSASGPLANLPYQATATGFTTHGSWKASGNGAFSRSGEDRTVSFQGGGKLRDADFRTVSPAVYRFGPHGQSLNVAAAVGGGQAHIDARQTGPSFQAKADLSNVSLGLLDQDFMGRFDASLELSGQGPSLSGNLDAKLAGAGERGGADQPTVDGLVKATLASNTINLDARLGNASGLASHVSLTLPAEASAAPLRIAIVRTQPMRGEIDAEGEIRPVWDLVMGDARSLSGQVKARATLAGTLADPRIQGEGTVVGGQFSDAASGLKLRGVTMSARLAENAIDINQFSGADVAGGQVSGSGVISLQRAGSSSFKLDLRGFRLIDNDVATAVASGQATVNRAADGLIKISGALTIDHADVAANPPTPSGVTPMDVVEVNRPVGTGGHLQADTSHAPDIELDVTLKSAGHVLLKGRGLNAELSLDAHVVGPATSPRISGVARVVRGDYDFAGKRFTFDSQGAVYLADNPGDIRLDLTATRSDPSLTAVIRIQGTAAKPRITLTSTPILPSDEVLSQVLFGSSASQLSPYQAAELASAVSTMAGGGGFDILGNLRNFAHLDRLALGGASTSDFAVSGGKYVTDNVYIELTGGRAGPSAQLEWRARKNLSIISSVAGSGGDSQVSVRWRKDY
jgi:translocation and assembly module TamB